MIFILIIFWTVYCPRLVIGCPTLILIRKPCCFYQGYPRLCGKLIEGSYQQFKKKTTGCNGKKLH